MTEIQIREHEAASRRGALEGAGVGAAIATSSGWYLNKRWPAYRSLPLSLKVLGGVIIVAPLLAIQAERRGLEYDRSQWRVYISDIANRLWLILFFFWYRDGVSVQMLEEKQEREERQWKQLSASEKMKDWAIRHQYSLIIGGWATSLCITGAFIWRNKYVFLPLFAKKK